MLFLSFVSKIINAISKNMSKAEIDKNIYYVIGETHDAKNCI